MSNQQIRVDTSRVTVEEYLELHSCISSGNDISRLAALMKFGEKVIDGGVMGRPMADLPRIFSQLVKCLQEESNTIAIAITQEYLKDKGDE
jgi:hypothetical protein